MNIMIDYDGTYTADVNMWRNIINLIQGREHKVYLVTSRDMDTPVEDALWFVQGSIPIIYCAYKAKRDVCEAQGIHIDIWIDNDPYYIDTGFITDGYSIESIKEEASGYER